MRQNIELTRATKIDYLHRCYFGYFNGAKTLGQLLMLSDVAKKHHAFVTEEEGGYLVAILKQPDKNKESYVEIPVQEGHYFYDRIRDAVAVLHVADTGTEVEGVGEAFATGVYHIVIDTDEHNKLKEGK